MRLRVRRLEFHDLPVRVEWFNTPAIYESMSIEVPMSIAGTQQWFQRTTADDKRRDFVLVEASKQGSPVSMCGLVDIDRGHSRAEIYLMVAPSMSGQGIGRATLRWLCNYGFRALGLNRLYLTTVLHNQRAQELYEGHGFILEGRLRNHLWHQGRFTDRLISGMLREEWERQPWAVVSEDLKYEVETE